MPWSYHIDKEHSFVLVEQSGACRADELPAIQKAVRNDLDFKASFRALFDLRGITDLKLSLSEIDTAAKNSPFDGKGRKAFLVDQNIMRGYARAYERAAIVGEGGFQLFGEIAEAKEWLGID
jgi:hypothetical protein